MPRRSPQTERLVEVIEVLAAGSPPLTLAEVARHLGLDKATCYPMMNELVRLGWLLRHPTRKTYHLGPRLVAVGRAAESSVDIIDFARPVLDELADEVGMAVGVVVPSGDELLIGDIRQPRSGGRRGTLGLRAGDYLGFQPPLGAALVAWAAEETIDRWIDRQPTRRRTAATRVRYLEVLRAIRSRGYAVEEFPPASRTLGQIAAEVVSSQQGHGRLERLVEVHEQLFYPEMAVAQLEDGRDYWPVSINAPIFDAGGEVTGVLCVLDSPEAMTAAQVDEVGRRVRGQADRLTSVCGGRTPSVA